MGTNLRNERQRLVIGHVHQLQGAKLVERTEEDAEAGAEVVGAGGSGLQEETGHWKREKKTLNRISFLLLFRDVPLTEFSGIPAKTR